MKRRVLIPLLIVSALVGGFFCEKVLAATTEYSQTNKTDFQLIDAYPAEAFPAQTLQQDFSIDPNATTTITFHVANCSPYTANPSLRFYLDTTSIISTSFTPASSVANDCVDVDMVYTINPSTWSAGDRGMLESWNANTTSTKSIGFANLYTDGSGSKLYGDADDVSYGDGVYVNTSTSFPDIADLYLTIAPAGETYTMAINFPANASSTPDFSSFENVYTMSDPENWSMAVNYMCIGRSQTFITSECSPSSPKSGDNWVEPPKFMEATSSLEFSDPKHFSLDTGVWYAKALFYGYASSTFTYLTESPVISFTIISGDYVNNFYTSVYTIPVEEVASSTPIQITCDPDDPLFQRSMCKLYLYLFVPESNAFDKFGDIKTLIANKPPIGYFNAIQDVLSGVNASGTPVFAIGNFTPLNNSIFTPLRTGITWLLWLFFGVVIFNRVRHLEI